MTTIHLYQDKNETIATSPDEAEKWITKIGGPLSAEVSTTLLEIFALALSPPQGNDYTHKVCRYSNRQGDVIDLPNENDTPPGYRILAVIYPCALNGQPGVLAHLYPYSFDSSRMKIRFVKKE